MGGIGGHFLKEFPTNANIFFHISSRDEDSQLPPIAYNQKDRGAGKLTGREAG
jgi:hypothetical protein